MRVGWNHIRDQLRLATMPAILRVAFVRMLMLAVLIGGCAATPLASRESDADAKRFESAPRAAIIYLYRADVRGGFSTLWINNRLLGETVAGTYFRVPVRPGRSIISASGSDMGRIAIDTQEDGVYFVEMQVHGESESNSTTIFRSVPADTAKQAIARCCALLENWRPGQERFGITNF